MVENESNGDNDSRMLVMEMYEVYVDVESKDPGDAVVAAAVVVAD